MAKKWAISIGINHYAHMPDLDFAKKDAEKMRDWFAASGFKSIYLFTDDSPPINDASKPYDSKPTGNTLKRFFRIRFQPNTLNIEDSIWFFFSGHGLRHEGVDYLMPCDSDSDSEGIKETAIPLKLVTTKLRESGAGDVVIIYDACRNKSKAGGQGFGIEKTKGVITLASCHPNERSYEIDAPGIKQGSFTFALLEALENTQLGRENYATFDRLYQRLRYRVPELNRQYNKPTTQKPSGYVEPDEKRYCILLPQRATTQDIEIYKKQALRAENTNNLQEAKRLLLFLWEIFPGDSEIRQDYDRVILKQSQKLELSIINPPQNSIAGVKSASITTTKQTKKPLRFQQKKTENRVNAYSIKRIEYIRIIIVFLLGAALMFLVQPWLYQNKLIKITDVITMDWIAGSYTISSTIVFVMAVIATITWTFMAANVKAKSADEISRWITTWWVLGLLPILGIGVSIVFFNKSDDALLSLTAFLIFDGIFFLYWLPTAISSPGLFKYVPPGAFFIRRFFIG